MKKIKVIQIGIGPLGQKIVQYITQREGVGIIGAVDILPEWAGRDLGEVCGIDKMGIPIHQSVSDCLKSLDDEKPDVAILTTVSSMEQIAPQIEEIVSYGHPVVSTCEELSCPWDISKELSKRIDQASKAKDVAVVGTGVNPGFLMDSLPIFLTSVCQKVNSIKVDRIQDAASRRIPFQKKIGAGLSLEAFEEKKKNGTLRHVGLTESVRMIASSMGWKITRTEDIISAIIAEKEISTDTLTIPAGNAAGVQQIGRGLIEGEEKIRLTFRASVGEPNPVDMVEIQGNPTIQSKIIDGVHGDVATCAITINAVKQILSAHPGLRTMADIPIVSYFC